MALWFPLPSAKTAHLKSSQLATDPIRRARLRKQQEQASVIEGACCAVRLPRCASSAPRTITQAHMSLRKTNRRLAFSLAKRPPCVQQRHAHWLNPYPQQMCDYVMSERHLRPLAERLCHTGAVGCRRAGSSPDDEQRGQGSQMWWCCCRSFSILVYFENNLTFALAVPTVALV